MDKISLSGVEFFAYHGVLESEKKTGQKFVVDVEIMLDTSICNDNLSKTVNYAEIAYEIVNFGKSTQFHLIETLANELAKTILKKFNLIKEITLTVHKPSAPIQTSFSDVSIKITRGFRTCYLAIGSNLGDKQGNLDIAVDSMNRDDNIRLISKSSYISTIPYGVTDQPEFLNGAVKIETLYTPFELLEFCKKIEEKAGRIKTRRWGERTLDVDIIMYSDLILFKDSLKIPHAEMHLREFVLAPLSEIEPYLIHPIYKKTVSELLGDLK